MTFEIQHPEDLKDAAHALIAFAGAEKLFIFEGLVDGVTWSD